MTIPRHPSKRTVRMEAMAMMLREVTRFPSGVTRMSPETAREIAGRQYQYLVSEGVVRK